MAELAIADRWGVGHSQFLAMPPADQEKALAYDAYRKSVCSACGTERAEWDPDRGGDVAAYVAELDQCPGCEARESLQSQVSRDPDVAEQRGVTVILRPRPRERTSR